IFASLMSTISAGLVNATNLTVTGTQAGAVTATNFNTAVVNTGDVNATRCIISNGPSRDGVLPGFTSAQIAAIQSYANDIADGPKIPNSFVAFGNANEETIYTVVSGKQSNGGAVPSNPYFRLASCSKLIGGIATAKLMADRWINTDTPIASYLGNYDASSNPNGDKIYDTSGNLLVAPWKSANRKIIDASGNVTTMQAAWTAWGATQNPPVTGACPDITVGHCLNHTVGLSYDYYTFGRYTGFLELCHDNTTLQRVAQYGVSDTPTTYAKGQTGTSVQNGPIDPPHHLFDASGNPTYTSDNYLTLMSTQPLSSLPGVLCEYSRGMDVMGFMFDQLIKQNLTKFQTFYNNTNIVDVITFIQQIILIPAGINDSWVYGGQSQPPADCKTNMLSSSTARNVTSAAGAKCIPYG
ncbi:MAG: hypothetical protein EBU08_21315, partial [Micrococcales bacterium]|nr:hypothetical protein [Micrococcales bacterium]